MNKVMTNKEVIDYINNVIIPEAMEVDPNQVPQEKKNKTLSIFRLVMNEEVNKDKSINSQQHMIESILENINSGMKEDAIIRKQSANKHMNGFDEFMEQGASKEITKALREAGLGQDVLKGLKLNIPHDYETLGRNKDVKVTLTLTRDDNGSPVIEYFAIWYRNEPIYEFTKNKIDADDSARMKNPNYLGKVAIPDTDGLYYTKWIDKRGKIRYRNDRGHFVHYDEAK